MNNMFRVNVANVIAPVMV